MDLQQLVEHCQNEGREAWAKMHAGHKGDAAQILTKMAAVIQENLKGSPETIEEKTDETNADETNHE